MLRPTRRHSIVTPSWRSLNVVTASRHKLDRPGSLVSSLKCNRPSGNRTFRSSAHSLLGANVSYGNLFSFQRTFAPSQIFLLTKVFTKVQKTFQNRTSCLSIPGPVESLPCSPEWFESLHTAGPNRPGPSRQMGELSLFCAVNTRLVIG